MYIATDWSTYDRDIDDRQARRPPHTHFPSRCVNSFVSGDSIYDAYISTWRGIILTQRSSDAVRFLFEDGGSVVYPTIGGKNGVKLYFDPERKMGWSSPEVSKIWKNLVITD